MTTCGEISVLVVEDDRFQIEGIVDNLSLEGFKVFGARCAQEAICLLQEAAGGIDLGILDIDLPGEMNGIDLLQLIRREYPDMQVVILSGKATLDNAVQALNFGAFSFLYKPCDPEYLLSTLRQAHDRRLLVEQNGRLLRQLAHTRNTFLAREAESIRGQNLEDTRVSAGRLIHEVSNQLMIILNNAEVAQQNEDFSEKSRKEFKNMAAVAIRATEILKLARVRLNEIEAEPMTIVDLTQTMNDVLEQMGCLMKCNGISVENECENLPNPVFGCRLRLEQVFVNLFLNAIEAMPRGGRIYVSIKRKKSTTLGGEEIVVTIRDSGDGIRAEKLDTIFERHSSTKDASRGLGLYLARSIIRQYAGNMIARNHDEGGAVFEIRLPRTTSLPNIGRVH